MHFATEQIKHLQTLLRESSRILIVSHFNPDGDAIGSSLGWYHFLSSQGKPSQVCLPNHFPAHFNFLPESEKIILANGQPALIDDLFSHADLIFIFDLNTLSRTGNLSTQIAQSPAKKILIDHHVDPDISNFDLIFSSLETSSTSELVFWITQALLVNPEKYSNHAMATCLYTGISTDTGSFSYACDHANTYIALANLIKMGIRPESIHRQIFDSYSENRMRLLGYCINEKMTIRNDLGIAHIYLSARELERFNFQIGDTEGIVNYLLKMSNIEVGVLIMERLTVKRLSFRSKGNFDVNAFARKYWSGGGHVKAAGGESQLQEKDLLQRLEELLENELATQKEERK